MIEAAGGSRKQHLDACEVGCKLHVVISEMRRDAVDDGREPILDQKAVSDAFEKMIVEMLMRIDKAGHHDHSSGVQDLVEIAVHLAAFDRTNVLTFNDHGSVFQHLATRINGHDVAISDQDFVHGLVFPRGPWGNNAFDVTLGLDYHRAKNCQDNQPCKNLFGLHHLAIADQKISHSGLSGPADHFRGDYKNDRNAHAQLKACKYAWNRSGNDDLHLDL